MRHCFDADMVLDLHCDDMALNHIYIAPRYQGLSDRLGSVATLLAEDSGGGSFDEVWSGLWISLQEALPNHMARACPVSHIGISRSSRCL